MAVQFEAYIGPVWRPSSSATAWNWTTSADRDLADQQAATVRTSFTAGGTTLQINNLRPMPAKGGVWVGPNGTGQGWEYIEYGSIVDNTTYYTIGTLSAEPSGTREHNGNHSAGASVKFWVPLNTNDGKFHFTEEMDQNLAATNWTATLAGVLAPRSFIRKNHALYIRTKTLPGGAWTAFALGWIEEATIQDDFRKYASWEITICSIAGILQQQHCPPLRAGDLDILRAGKLVKSDVILAHPAKERHSGDYIAAEPDLTADSMIDGDDESLCIFERVLGPSGARGSQNSETQKYGYFFVSEMNLTALPGLGKGYRWIQITAAGSEKIYDTTICSRGIWNGTAWTGGYNQAFCKINGSCNRDSKIIICENLTKFTAMNPLSDYNRIEEIGSGWFDNLMLDPARGDCIGLYSHNPNATGFQGPGGCVKWGDQITGFEARHDSGATRGLASGPGIDAPGNGQIIRYSWGSNINGSDDWFLSPYDTPGYFPSDGIDPWALFRLPGMGLQLYTDLTAGYTGVLEISDGATLSTNGLPASGTIQIGGEQLTYNNKTSTTINITARGANTTVATSHLATDPVYILHTGGLATDGYPIKTIKWSVRNGGNAPKKFNIRVSNFIATPRTPTNDDEDPNTGWFQDYDINTAVDNHVGTTYTLNLAANTRALWVLIEIMSMQSELARPRINTLQAIVDETLFDSTQWLPAGSDITDVYNQLFSLLGLPANAYSCTATDTNACEIVTGEKPAWATLTDLADYTNTMIKISPLSIISVTDNHLWRTDKTGSGTFGTPSSTWTRSNAKAATFIAERATSVRQLRMTWLNSDGSDGGTVVYPTTPADTGTLIDLPGSIYPSGTHATNALQRRFIVLNFPMTLAVEIATGDPTLRTGVFHALQWDFQDGSTADRKGLVQSIDHVLENLAWQTAIRMIQIREAGY